MSGDIRFRVDSELTKRVGTWFTVREIQETLKINPATLKPLLMKYARENLLRRRHVKGTARSVQFTPAAGNKNTFCALIGRNMPYRQFAVPPTLKGGAAKKVVGKMVVKASPAKKVVAPKKAANKSGAKVTKKTASKTRR